MLLYEQLTWESLPGKDAEDIASLLRELYGDRALPAPTLEQLEHTCGDAHVFVARDNNRGNKVVGICMMVIFQNFHCRRACIEEFIVAKRYRKRGIGRALLDMCQMRARMCHASSLELKSSKRRRAAHRLYRAFGLEHIGQTNVFKKTLM